MTREKMATMLKTLTGETDSDVLSTYLELAGEAIVRRAYPYANGEMMVPVQYHGLQVEIATYMLNKRGAEGQVSHGENGITRNWGSADIPDDMLSRITPYVGVIGR